jgi:hypothetical protein
MTGFTDRVSQGILNHIVGKSALFGLPTAYVALFTGVGSDAGSGFTEVSGGAYARVATAASDWNSAAGSAPSSINNANTITFPTATASWGNIIAFGLYDAASAGNLQAWDYFGNYLWLPATVSAASAAVITAKAHGFHGWGPGGVDHRIRRHQPDLQPEQFHRAPDRRQPNHRYLHGHERRDSGKHQRDRQRDGAEDGVASDRQRRVGGVSGRLAHHSIIVKAA